MTNKTYDQLIQELKANTLKLASSEISMQEAMALFEINIQHLNAAKALLTEYQGSVNKVLADNQITDFE